MGIKTNNIEALDELFAPHRKEMDVLKEALEEINVEENERKKEAAKNLIRECIDLQKRMDQAEKDFLSQKEKWDKQLGKAIKRLRNMVSEQPLDEDVEEEKPSESSE